MRACLLLLLFGRLLTAQDLPERGATVTMDGDVVDQDGRPIAGAVIDLRGARPINAVSDASGHFRLNQLSAGSHPLEVAHPGFLQMSRRITVKPGESVGGIRVTLTRQGVISGTVTDADGWPASHATVRALRYETWQGTRELWRVGSGVEADDLGRYRLGHLPAGRYYVLADPGFKLARWDQRNAPTYYPAAYGTSEAKPAAVEAGKVTGGIDIKLARVEGVQVSGRVVAPSGMSSAGHIPVMIEYEHPAGSFNMQHADLARDGTFTFRHVRRGTYTLEAGVDSSSSVSAGLESALGAQQKLIVADRDVTGVELTLRPLAFEVTGKVMIKGKGESQSATVTLGGANGRQLRTKTAADGTFAIKGVLPGRYWVSAYANGASVRTFRFNGTEVSNSLHLDGSSPGPLEISMSSGTVKVEGVVSDATGAPVQQAFVVFFGKNIPFRLSRTSWAVDQSGHFSLSYLVPGEYTVVAVSDPSLIRASDDAEFRRANANSIKTVTLVEGDNPKLALVLAQ